MEPEVTMHPIFRRGLDTVSSADLPEIKQLEEGWFVEFKSRCPDSQKLAKSISSFANAYGGLLIIGAEEGAKTRRLEKFMPMSMDMADNTKTKVRQAVEAHLQPPPVFFMKSLELPAISCESIDRWILLIHIPKGERAPFLHSNGCVYTRKGDSSSAMPLTDLGLLDRLWSECRYTQEKLKNRIDFLCSQSPRKVPKVELIISAETDYCEESETPRVTFTEFQSIALAPSREGATPLFNNAYPLDSSFIARYVERSADATSLLWDFDYLRNLHYIALPLATHIWTGNAFEDSRSGHQALTVLTKYLSNQEIKKDIFIVDFTPAELMIAIILHKVKELHRTAGQPPSRLCLNARVSGVRQSVVFVDLPRYNDHIKISGLPFVHREIGFLYPIDKPEPERWFQVKQEQPHTAENVPGGLDVANSMALFVLLAESLGISNLVTFGSDKLPCIDADVENIADTYTFLVSRALSFTSSENPSID